MRAYRHDVFQAGGVQGAAASIFDLLDEDATIGRRASEIASTLGMNRSTVSRALPVLVRAGLARKSGSQWCRGPATLEQAAEATKTTGSLERLRERHRRERERYREEQARYAAHKRAARLELVPTAPSTAGGADANILRPTPTSSTPAQRPRVTLRRVAVTRVRGMEGGR